MEETIKQVDMRSLDEGEHYFWLLDQISSMNFVVYAEVCKTFKEQELKRGLERLLKLHPVLQTRLSRSGDGRLNFFKDPQSEIELTWLKEASSNHDGWLAHIEQTLAERFDFDSNSLLRCHYVEFTQSSLPDVEQGNSVIALCFQHSLFDGRSGAEILKALLIELNHQVQTSTDTLSPQSLNPSMHSLMPQAFQWHHNPEFAEALVAERRKEIKKLGRPANIPSLNSDVVLGQINDEQHVNQPKILRRKLSSDNLTQLLQACRQYQCSLHGLIGAAVLAAVNQHVPSQHENTLCLSSPVDMRTKLRQSEQAEIGMYISTLSSNYKVDSNDRYNLWAMASNISLDLKRQLQRGDGHISYHQLKPFAFTANRDGVNDYKARYAKGIQTSLISNLGVISAPNELPWVEAISFAVCPMPKQIVFLALSSYQGQLILNFTFDQVTMDMATAQSIVTNSIDYLLAHRYQQGLAKAEIEEGRSYAE